MKNLEELRKALSSIDRRNYGAYKRIGGAWQIDDARTLHIDRVQGDPFASPSRLRVTIDLEGHGQPAWCLENPARRLALGDLLLRQFARAVGGLDRISGSGRSGELRVDVGDATILTRGAVHLDPDSARLTLRFRAGLPARGRSVLGAAATQLLCEQIPEAVRAVDDAQTNPRERELYCTLVEDHAHLQRELHARGLVAFVRDGSVLPRHSGVSSAPLEGAVPFVSPPSLRVSLETLHHGRVEGLGVPEGVTLITGGGFHGKTTLLEAIERGIDPHIPGDGREWVVTRDDAVKVRSEDGRSVVGVDLTPFVSELPGARRTDDFHSEDASGSTSLAAAIIESIEAGSRALLLDEDTCATNLLVRDARMQSLIERETLVPLVDRVQQLSRDRGVSTILVLGGSGDYLDVADRVILMEDYRAHDVTERARQVATALPSRRTHPERPVDHWFVPRIPLPASFDARRGRRDKVKARGLREIVFGEQVIDLAALEQLVDDSQARAIGAMLSEAKRACGHGITLQALVERIVERARTDGLHTLDPAPELAMVRPLELAAAINRLRSLILA